MKDLHFDAYQFQARPNRPVSAETGLSWIDYSRMGTIKRRNEGHVRRQIIPAWVFEPEKLRRVLAACIWRFVFQSRVPLPETFARDWRALKEASQREWERYANNQRFREARQLGKAVEKCGGLAEVYAGVIWRSWRLGQDSVTVGEALYMTPVAVRARLQRIRLAAKWLGYVE